MSLRKRKHLVIAAIWATIGLGITLKYPDSVLWVAFMSLYANIASEIAADQAEQAKEEVRDSGSK